MKIMKQLSTTSIKLPGVGQGMGDYTWDDSQIEILRAGIDLGMNFIDTAEGYDGGHAEEIVGKAVKGVRSKVIIGTKFSSKHNSYDDILRAAEGSLRRLQTDYIDLYQLHWPNPSLPLEETMAAMERLVREGKVRCIGIGNLYLRELQEARSALTSERVVSLQTEYNLFDCTVEDEILPFCDRNGILLIAYSPLDQGRIANGSIQRELLERLASKYNKTTAQIVLRWLISKPSVIAIPKAKNMKHLEENASSTDFDIDGQDIEEIDRVIRRSPIHVPPDRIRVSTQGQGNRAVYQTIEEAMENRLGNVPSPIDLAKSIVKEERIKPVRLICSTERNGAYELVEGRIRYWAWIIAYGNIPIPAYVREDWP